MRFLALLILLAVFATGGYFGYPYVMAMIDGVPISELDSDGEQEVSENVVEDDIPAEDLTLEAMAVATQQLIELSFQPPENIDHKLVDKLFNQTVQTHVSIMKETSSGRDLDQSQSNLLYATYSAVKMDPKKYREQFDGLTSNLISENPNGELASRASLLRILTNHNLSEPATANLFRDLNEFVVRYSPELGAKLFCTLSREFTVNNQRPSAELVLQHGIRTYRARPQEAILTNQLVSLGFNPPTQKTPRVQTSKTFELRWEPGVLPLPEHLQSKAYKKSSTQSCGPKRRS